MVARYSKTVTLMSKVLVLIIFSVLLLLPVQVNSEEDELDDKRLVREAMASVAQDRRLARVEIDKVTQEGVDEHIGSDVKSITSSNNSTTDHLTEAHYNTPMENNNLTAAGSDTDNMLKSPEMSSKKPMPNDMHKIAKAVGDMPIVEEYAPVKVTWDSNSKHSVKAEEKIEQQENDAENKRRFWDALREEGDRQRADADRLRHVAHQLRAQYNI